MGDGVLVGIVRERLVLRDGTVLFLPPKQAVREFAIGSSLTVSYAVKTDGSKLGDGIRPCA